MSLAFTKLSTGNRMSLGPGAFNAACNGAAAVTASVWVHIASTGGGSTTNNRVLSCFVNGTGAGFLLNVDHNGGSRRLRVNARSQGADALQAYSGTTTTVPTGTWVHLAMVVDYAGDTLWGFVNGTPQGASATSVVFGATTYTAGTPTNDDMIGCDDQSPNANDQFDGRIAEVALWNAALSADEIAVLARRALPICIRPANLRVFMPLRGEQSPEPDLMGRWNGTITGTIAAADHLEIAHPVFPSAHTGGRASAAPTVARWPGVGNGPLSGADGVLALAALRGAA